MSYKMHILVCGGTGCTSGNSMNPASRSRLKKGLMNSGSLMQELLGSAIIWN